ncbi:hypothetical protein D3C74_455030 [compost metagenome]
MFNVHSQVIQNLLTSCRIGWQAVAQWQSQRHFTALHIRFDLNWTSQYTNIRIWSNLLNHLLFLRPLFQAFALGFLFEWSHAEV